MYQNSQNQSSVKSVNVNTDSVNNFNAVIGETNTATSTAVRRRSLVDHSISADIRRAASLFGYNISTFKARVDYAGTLPEMTDLFMGLWYEGELSVLYADTNVGKSILAVQIAEHIARNGRRVIYADYELSDKGIEKRAVNPETGCRYDFHPNMICLTPSRDPDYHDECDDDDDDGIYQLMKLEQLASMTHSQVLVVDNITCLTGKNGNAETAIAQVRALLEMRDRLGISILVVGHLNKYDRTQPITVDSLIGSKRFIDLVDSAFAIGVSVNDDNTKYIVQTKVRNGERVYHSNNVLKTSIVRRDGLLQFDIDPGRTTTEKLLITPDRQSRATATAEPPELAEIRQLIGRGMTQSQIAEKTGIKQYRISRMLNRYGLADENKSVGL